MVIRRRFAILMIICLGLFSPWSVTALGSLPLSKPFSESLKVSVFASGLTFPMGIALLPDDSIMIGTSEPGRGNLFTAPGQLLRLVDANNDGAADDAGVVVASGLNGTIVNVRQHGELVFVTSVEGGKEGITIFRKGTLWSDALIVVGQISFQFDHASHQSYGLAVRTNPEDHAAIDLLFNFGASGNETGGGVVVLTGLVNDRLQDSSIYLVTIHDTAASLTADLPVLIATGLRNAAAFDFSPSTGDLVITENGIDGLEDVNEPLSADEVNIIPANAIGGEPEHFGFPDSWQEYRTGATIGVSGIAPFAAFQPIKGAESEGAAALAITSAILSDQETFVVGFHGKYNQIGDFNEENAVLVVDAGTGTVSTLIAPDAPGIGHIDSLLSSGDALYAIDLCSDGSLEAGKPCGVIYRISAA